MKRLFLITLAFTLLFLNSFGQTVISGRFESYLLSDYKIAYNQTILNAYQGDLLAEGKTSIDGNFSTSFKIPSEMPVILFTGNQFFKLWLIPKDSLVIKETSSSLYFKGSSSAENTFLYQSGIMQPYKTSIDVTAKTFEPVKHTTYLDSIESKRWQLYNKIIGHKNVSREFSSFTKGEINYFTYYNKSQYPLRFIHINQSIKQEHVPTSYYTFWNGFTLLDDTNLSDAYRSSLRDYIEYLARKKFNNKSTDIEALYNTQFSIMDSLLINHPSTRERQKAEAIFFLIKYFDLPQLTQNKLKDFAAIYPTSHYRTFLEAEWEKKNRSTLIIPSFKLKDTNGKLVDIKDFRGKVVYIDFWGSWCKACIEQMPNSAKLRQKFKNKDVAFLYIDFYDTQEKWLRAIKQRNIEGNHMKGEKENEPYFKKVFGIENGFPRYALIDKEGILITTSAPHPNERKAEELINTYLNKK